MSDPTVRYLLALEPSLAEIAEPKFREVVKLLEMVRNHDEIQAMLERLRPRLKRVRPPRRVSLQRLLYLPAEDLLEPASGTGDAGKVSRELMARAWGYIRDHSESAQRYELKSAVETAQGNPDDLLEIAREVWAWGAPVLAAGLEKAANDREARRELAGDDASLLAEMTRIVVLLEMGEPILQMREMLPGKPIRFLSAEHVEVLQDLLHRHAGGKLESAYALLLATAARMAVPAELIEQVARLNIGLSREDQATLLERLHALMLADMARTAREVGEIKNEDVLNRADSVKGLILAISAVERTFKAEGASRKEIKRLRTTAEKVVSEMVSDAKASVGLAVEAGATASLETQVETERQLLALRKCQGFAGDIGMESRVNDTLGGIAKSVKDKAAGLFATLSGKSRHPVEIKPAEEQMYWAVRMLELTGSPDEANKLRLQGMQLLDQKREAAHA